MLRVTSGDFTLKEETIANFLLGELWNLAGLDVLGSADQECTAFFGCLLCETLGRGRDVLVLLSRSAYVLVSCFGLH